MKTLYCLSLAVLCIILFNSCGNSILDNNDELTSERILFIKQDGTITQICSIKPDGTDIQTIASHDNAGIFLREGYYEAVWSPDKKYIAVTGGPAESLEYTPIWLMDNNGNLVRRLTWNGHSPSWKSNGIEIIFARRRGYEIHILDYYSLNINTLEENVILIADNVLWLGPDWSANGENVMFSESSPDKDLKVTVLQLSNNDYLRLAESESMDFGARWSGDESKIAYISGRYGPGYKIMQMENDGSNKTVIVDTLAGYNNIVWSPNDDKITFSRQKKLEREYKYAEGSDIIMMDIGTGETKQLTNFAADSVLVTVQDWK